MSDYYDPHPILDLERHLVLAGYLGHETRVVGYRLAALTGLTAIDLDRQIEHFAGKSIWQLVWNDGEARYRELENEHLKRSLESRPAGILTLGDGTLMAPENLELILSSADLAALELDLANFYWRLQSSPLAGKDYWHPLHPGPVESLEQVRPFYAARHGAMERAEHQISLSGKGRAAVVAELLELLRELSAG